MGQQRNLQQCVDTVANCVPKTVRDNDKRPAANCAVGEGDTSARNLEASMSLAGDRARLQPAPIDAINSDMRPVAPDHDRVSDCNAQSSHGFSAHPCHGSPQ